MPVWFIKVAFLLSFTLFSGASFSVSSSIEGVQGFDLNRYLGKWYEVARLENKFEDGLEFITAEYALREDGGISVTNRGYSEKKQKWKTVKGKAYFVDEDTTGFLKVTFFWPIYGAYVVFELDHDDYQYAFVAGPNESYLWLLSRTPNPKTELVDLFISRSQELGFDTEKLIFVKHDAASFDSQMNP